MNGTAVFNDAAEMLSSTNPYKKPLQEFHYYIGNAYHSLDQILRRNADAMRVTGPGKPEQRYQLAFQLICGSLEEYADDFPARYAVKQRIREKFLLWLREIAKRYGIEDPLYPESFLRKGSDTAVAMVRMLHSREGVTKEDMAQYLGITERAVLKNLAKLDHSLGDSRQSDEVLRIGGQPVQVKIAALRKRGEKKTRYYTPNTMHPIILQENVLQAGTLIQSLARNYTEHINDISYIVGMEIWSQLSEYGRERVRAVFTPGDPAVARFVEILDDDCPDETTADHFCTEREMREETSLSMDEMLMYCFKAGRICRLTLSAHNGTMILDQAIIRISWNEDGAVRYTAVREGKEPICFTKEQILFIE